MGWQLKKNTPTPEKKSGDHFQVPDRNQTGSEMTLEELFHQSLSVMGHPSSDSSIILRDLQNEYSTDEVTWLLQEWIRGKLDAFDPESSMPALCPRYGLTLRPSWDFVSGVLPGVNWGFLVSSTEEPPDLHHYGDFEMRPDGVWSFALLADDLPQLKQVQIEDPVHLPIPLILKNDHTGEERKGCLHLHIQRDERSGLVVAAKYRDEYFFGFNRRIRELAEKNIRGALFSIGASALEYSQYADALALFFSMAFTKNIPFTHRNFLDEDIAEGSTQRRALHSVFNRLSTLVFDQEIIKKSLVAFQSGQIDLYPNDRCSVSKQDTLLSDSSNKGLANPASSTIERKNRGGRPPKWSWEEAIHATWSAIFDGNLPDKVDPNCRRVWNKFMTNWFADRNGGCSPQDGEIRKRIGQIYKAINIPDDQNTGHN